MGTELANIEGMSDEALMALIGQSSGTSFTPEFGVPTVRINRVSDVEEGQLPPPIGTFAVVVDTDTVYCKTILFRPLLAAYQYRKWDNTAGKFSSTSVLFNKFSEEIPSDDGTLSCGKISKAAMEGCTDKQVLSEQASIKCSRILFGLVTGTGHAVVNNQLVERKFENTPSVIRFQGGNFIPLDNVIKELTNSGKLMFNHYLKLALVKDKKGGNVFYKIVPELTTLVAKMDEQTMGTLRTFYETLVEYNRKIQEKWTSIRVKAAPANDNEQAALASLALNASKVVINGEIIDPLDEGPDALMSIGA